MLKKLLNLILCIAILMQNFLFALPAVKAEEAKKEELIINSITQNGKELKLVDGVYQVEGLEEIIVHYTVKNTVEPKEYILGTKNSKNYFRGINGDYISQDHNLWLDINNEVTNVTYELFVNDGEEEKLLDMKNLSFRFTKFNEYNLLNSKLYVTEVKQGDRVIEPDLQNSNYYVFNKKQDITLKLKGENFNENLTYPLFSSMGMSLEPTKEYTGKELNEGVIINLSLKGENYLSPDVYLGYKAFGQNINAKPSYCRGIDYCYFNYKFIDSEDVSDYDVGFSYTNYKNKKIVYIREYNENLPDMYIISNKYHNEENPLEVTINGENFLDKNYNIDIKIKRNKNVIYEKNAYVNGLSLNNSASIKLDDFVSSNDKTYDEEKDKYIVEIIIDGITTKTSYMYGFQEDYTTINSEIFFENGKKNLSTFRGNGSYYFSSGFADTNRDAFNKFKNVYLRYVGDNFENNLVYDYELSYGKSDNQGGLEKTKILKTGKISGLALNTSGLMFAVDNENNYKYPTYRLEVKYKGELIYYSSPVLDLVDTPTFANVSLTNGNNKDLYLRMDDYTYVATRNFPINLAISGIGFDDKKDYNIIFSESYWHQNGSYDHEEHEYVFKGKDLNNGKAIIKLKKKIAGDITKADLYVMYSSNDDGGFGQGGFSINFVNSKDLLPNIKQYFIDNASDLIKNITKNTSVEDFSNNIDVANNGKIKIYDSTGEKEIIGNVGTGMIARVTDENDNSLLDLDVVVKGDVSGDGNISITDLVKVKRHLSEDEELTGVYKIAGSINDTGNIEQSDLEKITKDVAEIEEVQ